MDIQSKNFRFGIFIILASLTLIIMAVILTSRQFLQKKDNYYIAYRDVSVSGLEVGSPVKYLGLTVGTVEDISIDPEQVNEIIVKVRLKKDTPIKENARADLSTLGITGMKMIEIRGGTQSASLLEPGEFIPAGTSITEEITGKAEVISDKLEQLLNNLNILTGDENLNNFLSMVDNTANVVENINRILTENRDNLFTTIQMSSRVSMRLDSLTISLQKSAREISSITAGDTLKDIVRNVSGISQQLRESDLRNLIKDLGEVARKTSSILKSMDYDLSRGSQVFHENMRKLQISLDYLNETSRLISQDPSVLLRGAEPAEIPDKNLEQ